MFVFGVNIDTEALFSDDIILQKEKERHTGFERQEGDWMMTEFSSLGELAL